MASPKILASLVFLAILTAAVGAEEIKEIEVVPQTLSNLSWNIYLDTYFAFDFNQPHSKNRDFATQPARHNEFNLNLAVLSGSYFDENMRARLALQTGTYVQANLANEPAILQFIHEASAGVRLWDQLWLDMGVLPSHISWESAISKDSVNYSRAIITEAIPYYETGARLSYAFLPNLSAQLLLLNGWQNIQDKNSYKAVGSQVQFKPLDNLLLNWSTFVGNEAPDDQPVQTRIFNDIYAAWSPTENIDAIAVFDLGFQQRANAAGFAPWAGGALMGRYRLTPEIAIGGRIEHFSDREKVIFDTKTDNGFQVTSAALNLDYQLNPHMLWRTEGRFAYSVDPIFTTRDANSNSQTNFTLTTSLAFWY